MAIRVCVDCSKEKYIHGYDRCSACYARHRKTYDPEFKRKLNSNKSSYRKLGSVNPINPELFSNSKYHAGKREIEWSLTTDEWKIIQERADGKCEVTGIPFSMGKPEGSQRSPFRASIDRIDSNGIYEFKNVRLVCLAVNTALSDFGDKVLQKISNALFLKEEKWEDYVVYV